MNRESKKERSPRHKIELGIMAILLVAVVIFTSVFTAHQFDSNEIRIRNFFCLPKNSVDVVNIGASEIYTGLSPEYIWNKYGVTTYNLATTGAHMGLVKTQVMSAIEEQSPKLITISLNGTIYGDKRATHEGYTRMWIDNMPEGQIREEAIEQLITGDQSSYRLKILKYHENISRIGQCFSLLVRETKAKITGRYLTISGIQGMASKDDRDTSKIVDASNYDKVGKMGDIAEKQLYDLLNYLRDNNITNVVFLNMPRYYDDDMLKSKEKINKGIEIIRSYGYEVYDFDKDVEEMELDAVEDFYNENHLNIIGQRKMSDYYYTNVVSKYTTSTELDDETRAKWNENYEAYSKVYSWISSCIQEKSQCKYTYDYKVVDHILDGTIDKYEKFMAVKANIVKKAEVKE